MKIIHPAGYIPEITKIAGWKVGAVAALLIGGYLYFRHKEKKIDEENYRNG